MKKYLLVVVILISISLFVRAKEKSIMIDVYEFAYSGIDNILLYESSFFKSTSGDISLVPKNSIVECTFDLSASSGSLCLASETARNKMTKGNGPVLITGKSTSGSQKYITGIK